MDRTNRICALALFASSLLPLAGCAARTLPAEPAWTCTLTAAPGPVPAGRGRARIAVAVRRPDGAPVPGLLVRLQVEGGAAAGTPVTGPDGAAAFTVGSARAGTVRVSASVEGAGAPVRCGAVELAFTEPRLPELPAVLVRGLR